MREDTKRRQWRNSKRAPMSIIESTQIAFFQHFGATGENVPLSKMLDDIKRGKWAGQVNRLRAKGRESEKYDETKKKLPAFMLSGTTTGGHKAADVIEHSGLLQIDVDKVGAEQVADLRDRIGEDRHILAAWISPSGDGVKAIMRIPASIAGHKAAFAAAVDYMRESFGLEIDENCSDVGRLCFVSHDPALVLNLDAMPLEVSTVFSAPACPDNSSTILHSTATHYTLHNKAFTEFENLRPIYQRHVARFCSKPQRGHRNRALVEIVSGCFCVVAPEFVLVFAEEFFRQHFDIYQDYGLEKYRSESINLLEGCHASYPSRLSENETASYSELTSEEQRTAFRICHSLSRCESDASLPPPLFALSACELGARSGLRDMETYRILKGFEKCGMIKVERKGTRRELGKPGLATVWRWLL